MSLGMRRAQPAGRQHVTVLLCSRRQAETPRSSFRFGSAVEAAAGDAALTVAACTGVTRTKTEERLGMGGVLPVRGLSGSIRHPLGS